MPPPQSGLEGDAIENNRALDRALADPRALRALDLQGYPLAPFPEAVRGLVQLRELTLRDAGLQGLPAWLAELRALVLLVVAGNADVVSLPPAIAAITTLRILDLGPAAAGVRLQQYREDVDHAVFKIDIMKVLLYHMSEIDPLKP